MKIRESCLQTGNFIYKPGISLTKQDFQLQRGSLGLQRGFSGYYLPSFRTVEELNAWIDTELAKFEIIKAEILNNGYKHLCVTCKDGHKEYYTIINISFKKFEIFCKHFRGNSKDLENENLLMREDVRGLKLRIHK